MAGGGGGGEEKEGEGAGVATELTWEANMKAVLKNGVICPKEPVPPDWSDGTELDVERARPQPANGAVDQLDRWYEELEDACAQMDTVDDQILKAAVLEVRRQEKEQARREAGLP